MIDQKIINLFDEYTHKPLSRQEFISRLVKMTGSLSAALSILPLLEVNAEKAVTVAENDLEIRSEEVSYSSKAGEIKAYFSSPAKVKKAGTVLVIHENRGLNEHIRDVARRVAKAGYLALAPDALSLSGGTPKEEDKAREFISQLDPEINLQNFLSGLSFLRKHPHGNGKTATVGFCWGGAMSNQLAVHDPALNAAVVFYGKQPDVKEVDKIKAKLQFHYAGLDERINQGISVYEEALKARHISYESYLYEGMQHAFHNDTSAARYNESAAKLAWERTLTFFKQQIQI